jgi:Rod binding domain-containing protein
MKLPPAAPLKTPVHQKVDDPRITPEMKKAAEGLETMFTSEMMKAMRGTVEKSEFSLHNSASDLYEGMLDQEYAEISARQNSIGLSEQIVDYWLRSLPEPKYNEKRNSDVSSVRTGGTHEGQSNE